MGAVEAGWVARVAEWLTGQRAKQEEASAFGGLVGCPSFLLLDLAHM